MLTRLVLLLPLLLAAADQDLEYRVKAAFLLNFTKFIEFPTPDQPAPAAPFALCILGEDPFGPVLDQLVEGETLNRRPIAVRRIHADAVNSCGLVYIAANQREIPQILKSIGPGILTVGEGDTFLDEGGMIAFIIENRRVRFNIDRAAARRAGLQMSSRLLSVARSVR